MHIFNKFKGTKGFISMWERVIRFRYMITEEAKRRAKILSFWEEFGEGAVKKAYGVSRRTLFRWQEKLSIGQGKLESLNSISKAPKKKRSRIVPEEVVNIIIRNRKIYWKFGKKKLQRMLEIEGFVYSESTVGRFVFDLKKRGLLPDPIRLSLDGRTGRLHQRKRLKIKKKRRPKNYEDCFEIDTIVRFIYGLRRYVITAINTKTKFGFALTYSSHSSDTASHFLKTLRNLYGKPIKAIQTDNGSEFAKHFHQLCLKENIDHYFIYPRSPKMNAHIERFNRTLQEEFIFLNSHKMLDLKEFNADLMNYLHWYNTERPHHSLNLFSPMQYIVNTLKEECQMW